MIQAQASVPARGRGDSRQYDILSSTVAEIVVRQAFVGRQACGPLNRVVHVRALYRDVYDPE